MNICFDAKVLSQDGIEVGKIKRIIYYPRLGEVTHLVVHKGVLLPHDTLIPMSLVQGSRDSEITLHTDSEDVGELPRYDEGLLRSGPAGTHEVVETPSGEHFGVTEPPDRAEQLRRAIHIEPGSLELARGIEVVALDGVMGSLRCLQVDHYSNRLTYVVAETALTGKRGKRVSVPAEWVSGVEADKVALSVPSQQALSGPPPPAGPYLPVEPGEVAHT